MINGGKPDGKRIRRVIGIDFPIDMHEPFHHFYDLLLVRPAIARELLLHLERRHGDDGYILAIPRQQDDSPRLGHFDARGDIRIEIKGLHPHELGPVGSNELADPFIDDIQPFQITLVLISLNDPVIHRRDGRAILLHHPEPAAPGARVNSQYPHHEPSYLNNRHTQLLYHKKATWHRKIEIAEGAVSH